jgi:hypothetical protein
MGKAHIPCLVQHPNSCYHACGTNDTHVDMFLYARIARQVKPSSYEARQWTETSYLRALDTCKVEPFVVAFKSTEILMHNHQGHRITKCTTTIRAAAFRWGLDLHALGF